MTEAKRLKEFKTQLKQKAKLIEKQLDKFLPKEDCFPQTLHQAMRYSTMVGGKRIRPLLVMESAKLFGLSPEKVFPTACGVEMIHTYSLIHDDLPLMDNDDFRRGRPTCHKIFGEAVALLAGDALLTNAFTTIAKNAQIDGISNLAVIDVIKKISAAAGSAGMVGGQTVDIESVGMSIDEELLYYISKNKTAALICSALWSGARLAEAPLEDLDTMDNFGQKVGLIFQIVDDVLDIKGDEKTLGKPIGSDEKNNKNTFPTLLGFEKTANLIDELSNDAKYLITTYPNNEFFINFIDFLVKRQY